MIKVGPYGGTNPSSVRSPFGGNSTFGSNSVFGSPFGGNSDCSSKAWDEKGVKGLSRIYICHGYGVINSIQTGYVEGNSIVLSEKHGGNGSRFDTVTLDYPSEFLTGINGHTTSSGIGSITFVTNQSTYGPFGSEKYNPAAGVFGSVKPGEMYVITFGNDFFGFHGYSNDSFLEKIGAYVKPSLTTCVGIKSEPTV
ncbi:inactive protein RESTRICTED TEV MOVEMENT 1-like [Thalictrum thalictroides]|uniref:Inactive protein RESTRICTED TEV MOVEMENT 1-like n=1 Tax=Thalictrum thalictroides TaxID=46969 RepID=A0A7J6VE58_THATH|nr:inactive protein RESTRICTED TEV MOVEMENT 1-like [Thalictrum thalictroides]